MNYAASIGDDNPWYLDDTREGGVVAPPMLAIALTWRISEHFFDYWGEEAFPYEVLARQVHYSESIQWKRAIRPGETLRVEGQVDAILPHRAGTHLILAYTAYDKGGEVVFVERIGGLLRGVVCEDEGKGRDCVTEYGISSEDAPVWSRDMHISKLAAHLYDGCADVHFPIHISPAFAQAVGLPGIIFQGTGTLAMAVREITAAEADNDPRRIAAVQCRFTGMVRPDSIITVKMLKKEPAAYNVVKCHFAVLDAKGKTVLRDGCVDILQE
jgi:acyl dehydratase